MIQFIGPLAANHSEKRFAGNRVVVHPPAENINADPLLWRAHMVVGLRARDVQNLRGAPRRSISRPCHNRRCPN